MLNSSPLSSGQRQMLAHKFGLIKAAANKGPKAIQAATETAAKAAKRRDSFARKLEILGVNFKD